MALNHTLYTGYLLSNSPACSLGSSESFVSAPVRIPQLTLTTLSLMPSGYAGLMIAHKYKYETPMTDYVDLIIYEKNRKSASTKGQFKSETDWQR